MPINFLRKFTGGRNAMEREAGLKLLQALIDAGFTADDQRADMAIEKVAREAGLERDQFRAALRYAREQGWIAETNKAAWSTVTQVGADAVSQERS
jgi:hypothetical protein